MSTALEVESINGTVNALFEGDLSTAARKREFIADARDLLAQAEQTDAAILGHVPAHITLVDGVQTEDLNQVGPRGTVTFEFPEVGLGDIFEWVFEQLQQHSPIGSLGDEHPGLYRRSHLLFADGIETDPTGQEFPAAEQYVFVNAQPYARKVEQGESPQFPEGVYEGIAALAQQRFPQYRIRFAYRDPQAGSIQTHYARKTARSIRHSARSSALGTEQQGQVQPAIIITTGQT